MLHKNVLVGERHPVHDWEVADAAALAALVPIADDVGRIAKMTTPLSFHILANHTGPVWHELATAGDIVSDHGALAGLVDDDHEQYALSTGDTRAAIVVEAVPTLNTFLVWDGTDLSLKSLETITGFTFGLYPINTQSGTSYSLVLGDKGKFVTLNNASPIILTIEADSTTNFPVGSAVHLQQLGEGAVTITPAVDVTLIASTTLTFRAVNSSVTVVKIAANTWSVFGDLEI